MSPASLLTGPDVNFVDRSQVSQSANHYARPPTETQGEVVATCITCITHLIGIPIIILSGCGSGTENDFELCDFVNFLKLPQIEFHRCSEANGSPLASLVRRMHGVINLDVARRFAHIQMTQMIKCIRST